MMPLFPRWERFCNANPGFVIVVNGLIWGVAFSYVVIQVCRLAARVAALEACE